MRKREIKHVKKLLLLLREIPLKYRLHTGRMMAYELNKGKKTGFTWDDISLMEAHTWEINEILKTLEPAK